MKKLHFFGLLLFAMALAMVLIACDDGNAAALADFVSYGTDKNGRAYEIVISQRPIKNVLTPAAGNYYVIRYLDNGQIISRGRIEDIDGQKVSFRPENNSEPFSGTLHGSGTFVVIDDIPEGNSGEPGDPGQPVTPGDPGSDGPCTTHNYQTIAATYLTRGVNLCTKCGYTGMVESSGIAKVVASKSLEIEALYGTYGKQSSSKTFEAEAYHKPSDSPYYVLAVEGLSAPPAAVSIDGGKQSSSARKSVSMGYNAFISFRDYVYEDGKLYLPTMKLRFETLENENVVLTLDSTKKVLEMDIFKTIELAITDVFVSPKSITDGATDGAVSCIWDPVRRNTKFDIINSQRAIIAVKFHSAYAFSGNDYLISRKVYRDTYKGTPQAWGTEYGAFPLSAVSDVPEGCYTFYLYGYNWGETLLKDISRREYEITLYVPGSHGIVTKFLIDATWKKSP